MASFKKLLEIALSEKAIIANTDNYMVTKDSDTIEVVSRNKDVSVIVESAEWEKKFVAAKNDSAIDRIAKDIIRKFG